VTMQAGVPLQFTVTASDLDLPRQKLNFSLGQGSPFGIILDPVTGQFTWTPTATQATLAQTIAIRVTDDGSPPLSAVTTFTASPQGGAVSAIRVQVSRVTAEVINVCMEGGDLGTVYALETSTNLHPPSGDPQWTVLQTIWKGSENFCEVTSSTVNTVRYYRIRRAQ